MTGVKGTPWEPVPGKVDRRIPVAIDEKGNRVQPTEEDDDNEEQPQIDDEEETTMQFREGPDKFHVSKRAIERYGPTEGCPACTHISQRSFVSCRVGMNHNDMCRKRITSAMKEDPQYRRLMQKHQRDAHVTMVDQLSVKLEEQAGNLRKSTQRMKQRIRDTTNNITQQLDQTMLQMLIAEVDVAEVYSQPRISSMAQKMGLRAGWGLDLTTNDTDGKPWDFNVIEMRNMRLEK